MKKHICLTLAIVWAFALNTAAVFAAPPPPYYNLSNVNMTGQNLIDNATITNSTVNGFTPTAPGGVNGNLQINSSGSFGAYAGTSCTNQFARSLDASGAATCATVGSNDLAASLALVTPVIGVASGTSLTFNDVTLSRVATSKVNINGSVRLTSSGILEYGTSGAYIQGTSSTLVLNASGSVSVLSDLKIGTNAIIYDNAPTISSGFCTGAAMVVANNTAAFSFTVGTSCAGSTGVIGFPTASNGWSCSFNDLSAGTDIIQQVATTTTSVSVQHFSMTTGVASNFQDNNIINAHCVAY